MKLNTVLKGTIKSTEVYITAIAIELSNYQLALIKLRMHNHENPSSPYPLTLHVRTIARYSRLLRAANIILAHARKAYRPTFNVAVIAPLPPVPERKYVGRGHRSNKSYQEQSGNSLRAKQKAATVNK